MPSTKKASSARSKKTTTSKKSTTKSKAKKTTNTKTSAKKAASKTTKKVSKKATNKKSTAPKKTTKNSTRKSATTDYSPTVTLPEHAFWVNDGAVLHSLDELADALAAMDRMVYEYHVTDDRHDFADWVEQALACTTCAEAMRAARTPSRACTVVVTHLKQYKD